MYTTRTFRLAKGNGRGEKRRRCYESLRFRLKTTRLRRIDSEYRIIQSWSRSVNSLMAMSFR